MRGGRGSAGRLERRAPRGVANQGLDLGDPGPAVLGQGGIEVHLGGAELLLAGSVAADGSALAREERAEAQRGEQRLVVALGEAEHELAGIAGEQLHASGSMVAWREYFWSSWT